MYTFNERIKKIIAENCFGYEPHSILNLYSMANLSPSCENCKNFIESKCKKGLFDEIRETISNN
ncbi:hypothetical protein SH2C18_51930 [Clostridium sediminicola]|uniref:hypothetical protein n=1 Tax=Clostridium sediminicola TaxID=3114879 RepID=UPI0031F2006C